MLCNQWSILSNWKSCFIVLLHVASYFPFCFLYQGPCLSPILLTSVQPVTEVYHVSRELEWRAKKKKACSCSWKMTPGNGKGAEPFQFSNRESRREPQVCRREKGKELLRVSPWYLDRWMLKVSKARTDALHCSTCIILTHFAACNKCIYVFI